MKRFFLLLCVALASASCLRAQPVGLFYLTSSPDSVRSFLAHSSQIDLLVPTWYQVDENGLVTGAPDRRTLQQEELPRAGLKFRRPASFERVNDPRVQTPRLHRLSV
jgi:hypothetical protein